MISLWGSKHFGKKGVVISHTTVFAIFRFTDGTIARLKDSSIKKIQTQQNDVRK